MPLIDVVFLLLLFLAVTSRFIPSEEEFVLRSPEAEEATRRERLLEPLVLRMRSGSEGRVTLEAGGRRLPDLAALDALLAELPKDTPVVVAPGDEIPYARVVEAYDACHAAGLSRVALGRAPEPPS